MAPLVSDSVEVARTMMTDKNAEDGLRWSLTLISKNSWLNNLGGFHDRHEVNQHKSGEGVKKGHPCVAQWQACNGLVEYGRRHAFHLVAILVH